jgi:hypothetical protein
MLTFQASFDPYHSIFRALRLVIGMSDCKLEWDKYRILDFYLVFPFRSVDFKFRRGQLGLRKVAKAYEDLRPYGTLPDDQDLMIRMAPIQGLAVQALVSKGILDHDLFKRDILAPGSISPAEQLTARAHAKNEEEADLIGMLREICLTNPVLGPDGVKSRSGLLEYRNDPV